MARSYKRDKNGRFAGGGSSSVGTSRIRQEAQRQRGNIMAGGSQKSLRKFVSSSSQEKTSRTLRRSSIQRANLKDSSYAGKPSTTRRGNTVSYRRKK